MRWVLFTPAGATTGFRIKRRTATRTPDILFYFVGKYFPFLAAGGALDFHLVQRLVAFKPRTMLIWHDDPP
jgi:hypothetical protein